MKFNFKAPQDAYKKMNIVDVLPGTVFCNAYHDIEKIINGNERIGIYMKVDSTSVDGYIDSNAMKVAGNFKTIGSKFKESDVVNSWAISLKNGDLHNFVKEGKEMYCWIMNAEMNLNLVKN